MSSTCIFIFTRDLRIHDNTALNVAAKKYKNIIPLFIFTDNQVKSNSYKSQLAIDFMKNALINLKQEINKLNIIQAKDTIHGVTKVLSKLKGKVTGIVITKDYTPYARKREDQLVQFCKKTSLDIDIVEDYLLNGSFVLNGSKQHYKKFTPFYGVVSKNTIRKPYTDSSIRGKLISLNESFKIDKATTNLPANADNIKTILNDKASYIKNYTKCREIINIDGTRMSVYLKFGMMSIREFYYLNKGKKEYIRSLIWRDFYYTYYYFSPEALEYGDFYTKDKVKWTKTYLKEWKTGKTGFPIVDAAMTQLNKTGYMHNRARMIVASFLAKVLLVDWKEGEKYFSNKLLDIDWVINTANWQNVVSVAKHSQPYFRVFNPWVQSKKYDPKCEYIKKWLPELKDVPAKDIHNWNTTYSKYQGIYRKPIVDYNKQKELYLSYFKK